MNPIAEYGNRQLNLFYKPLVAILEDGFQFKGKKYSWDDVKEIMVWDPPLGLFWGVPFGWARASILLKDGKKIRFHGRLIERKGHKSKLGHLSNKNDVFDELLSLFKSNSA